MNFVVKYEDNILLEIVKEFGTPSEKNHVVLKGEIINFKLYKNKDKHSKKLHRVVLSE